MSIFIILDRIGISRERIMGLTADDILRIEKLLIAEYRLNDSISKQQINDIIELLSSNLNALKAICEYDAFFGILSGQKIHGINHFRRHSVSEIEQIKLVVARFFSEEITYFITINCQGNDLKNLNVLVYYKVFLSRSLIDVLIKKLEGKIDFALAVLIETPPHGTLQKKIKYISRKEFYVLLGDVDRQYFLPHFNRILSFIADYAAYTKHTVFFDRVINNIYYYDITNINLRNLLSSVNLKYGGQNWIIYAFVGAIFAIFFGPILYITNQPATPSEKRNYWEDQKNDYSGRIMYLKEKQRMDMENFVEARMHSQYNPQASRKAEVPPAIRYRNPFLSKMFNGVNSHIRNGKKNLHIFNNTDRECVMIAYFYEKFDQKLQSYIQIEYPEFRRIYALYIPSGDSIKIDYNMRFLRLYMGRRLAGYNTYKGFVYPDSTDFKYSVFSKADSMLFAKGFIISPADTLNQKNLNLVISMPSATSYEVSWTGKFPLYLYRYPENYMTQKWPDSATRLKPLILDLKFPKLPEEVKNPMPRTFIPQ